MLLLALVALAMIALALWWIFSGGQVAERAPGSTGQGQTIEPGSAPSGEWVDVFLPSDPTTVRTMGGTSATVMQGDDERFLRALPEGPESAVAFEVGPGILERIAGRRAIFSLTARAEEGQETQISVSCDFGALGGCGRMRYAVGSTRAEYLFEVELPDRSPGGPGRIIVAPDIEARGRVLEILSLRVMTAD